MECCRRFILRRDATNRSHSRHNHCGNAVTDHHLYAQRDKRVRPHYLYSYGDSPVAEICCREPRQVVSAGLSAGYFTVIARLKGDAGVTCADGATATVE